MQQLCPRPRSRVPLQEAAPTSSYQTPRHLSQNWAPASCCMGTCLNVDHLDHAFYTHCSTSQGGSRGKGCAMQPCPGRGQAFVYSTSMLVPGKAGFLTPCRNESSCRYLSWCIDVAPAAAPGGPVFKSPLPCTYLVTLFRYPFSKTLQGKRNSEVQRRTLLHFQVIKRGSL